MQVSEGFAIQGAQNIDAKFFYSTNNSFLIITWTVQISAFIATLVMLNKL